MWRREVMKCDHRNSKQVVLIFSFPCVISMAQFAYLINFVLCTVFDVLFSPSCGALCCTRVRHLTDRVNETARTSEIFRTLLCYVLLMALRWCTLTFADALCLKQISCCHKTACPEPLGKYLRGLPSVLTSLWIACIKAGECWPQEMLLPFKYKGSLDLQDECFQLLKETNQMDACLCYTEIFIPWLCFHSMLNLHENITTWWSFYLHWWDRMRNY